MQSGEDLVCGLQGPYGILAVTKPAELLVCLLGLSPRITTPNPNPLASPNPNSTLTQPNPMKSKT